LQERGYARTTARDLVAASGTNLASIGYHFGSKDALLVQAIEDAFEEYTEQILAVAQAPADPDAGPLARVRASWMTIVEQFAASRPVMVAFVEALSQAERDVALCRRLAGCYERLRQTIARAVLEATPDLPVETARTLASFHMAVIDGLMVQWLLDSRRTPGGGELFDAAALMFTGPLASEPSLRGPGNTDR